MSGIPVKSVDHYMSNTELEAGGGSNGWKQLLDDISKRYNFVPASVEGEEHYISVYASKADGHMIKVEHPKGLFMEVWYPLH